MDNRWNYIRRVGGYIRMRRDLKIMDNSNAPWVGSGYRVEIRDLMYRWVKDGWKVAMVGMAGLEGGIIQINGYPVYPRMNDPWGTDAMLYHGKHFGANVILTFL